MILRNKLAELASDINDNEPGYEYSRHSVGDVLRWWNEGSCLVAQLRPDLFTRVTVLKLKPGAMQDVSPCQTVSRVLGQADQYGNILALVGSGSASMASRWIGPPCPPPSSSEFRLLSYVKDPLSKGRIQVSPPVPPATDVYLSVSCSVGAREYMLSELDQEVTELDCGSVVAVHQWVIFRALWSFDERSVEHQKAMTALRLFFQLIQVKFRADIMQEMGIVAVPKNTKLMSDSGTLSS